MNDLSAKRQQFQDRLDEIESNGQGSVFSDQLSADSASSLQAWEQRLDVLLEEHRRVLRRKPSPRKSVHLPKRKTRLSTRLEARLLDWCRDTDEMILTELALGQHPLPAGFQGDYRLVDNDKAMKAAIVRACGLESVPPGVQWRDDHLGVFHIPGQGTLINPSHYARMYGEKDLKHNQDALARVVGDLAMERWGWGFLLEYTRLGKQAGDAGLWPAMLAYRGRLPHPDQCALALAQAIDQSWLLLRTGWLDWVWQYVIFKAHRPVGETLYERPQPGRLLALLVKVQKLFPLFVNLAGFRLRLRSLADLVKFIFLEQADLTPTVNQQIVANLQRLCLQHDERVREMVGLTLSHILGRLYFARLENQIGILSTPYATLIAAHEPGLDLSQIETAADFNTYVTQDPRRVPDVRLAMLAKLDAAVKYDPGSMFTAAWESLRLEGPREFFQN